QQSQVRILSGASGGIVTGSDASLLSEAGQKIRGYHGEMFAQAPARVRVSLGGAGYFYPTPCHPMVTAGLGRSDGFLRDADWGYGGFICLSYSLVALAGES